VLLLQHQSDELPFNLLELCATAELSTKKKQVIFSGKNFHYTK
jgi:hypothetical protein